MKELKIYSLHYEFEVRCAYCDLASFIDTVDIINGDLKTCPHCNKPSVISKELKSKALESFPDNFRFNGLKPYEKLYDIFSFSVWRVIPDYECPDRIMITENGGVWDFNDSQVAAEMLIIQHFIEEDQHIDWSDLCIELVERFKK